MSLRKKIATRTKRRALRSRKSLLRGELPRVSVQRTLNHLYAQVIDDNTHTTIASSSTLTLKDLKGDKKEQARAVANDLAKKLVDKGVERVMFDRGSYLYHGRIAALAEGLREGGLKL